MAIVNRLLDAFFRTLDAVDIARERIDRALGRAPRPVPWATEWSPTPDAPVVMARAPVSMGSAVSSAMSTSPAPASASTTTTTAARPKAAAAGKSNAAASKASAQKAAAPVATTASSGGRKKPGRKPAAPGGGNRKGSVDRKGVDIDSARAKAIFAKLGEDQTGVGIITEDASLGGKRVLARVLWALYAANQAGSELGLTAVDASALLHLAASMEVYATNVARTCRDEDELIEESEPDGRSKRYKLTAKGLAEAAKIATRPL